MKTHIIKLDEKYIKGIEKGQIKLLIFTRKVIHDFSEGDIVQISCGARIIQKKIVKGYVKSFKELTDKEAAQAGFLNKGFLRDELSSQEDFDIITKTLGMDDILLFLLLIENKSKEPFKMGNLTINGDGYTATVKPYVDIFSKYQNKHFYNYNDTELV